MLVHQAKVRTLAFDKRVVGRLAVDNCIGLGKEQILSVGVGSGSDGGGPSDTDGLRSCGEHHHLEECEFHG